MILAILVASTVGTYVASSRGVKRYRSSAQVFVSTSPAQAIVSGGNGPGTDRTTLDQARLLLSQSVTDAVIQQLKLTDSAPALEKTVSATPDTGSNFVLVTAERGDPIEAASIANAYVEQYQIFRDRQYTSELNASISRVRKQLGRLPKGNSLARERENLQGTIGQLQAARAVVPSRSRQIDAAVPATVPTSPRPKRDALFAAGIALLLGVALAFSLERFDRRIKRVEEIADIYGVAMLTTIPHTAILIGVADGNALVPDVLREPFRALRTNIQLSSVDHPLRCLTVTSAIPGEGKSTVVRNLALTYREWGMNVVVVEADLRRPTLSRSFGVDSEDIGLTSVLTGEVDLDEALFDIAVDASGLEYLDKVRATGREAGSGAPAQVGSVTDTRMALLPSGATPPNPQAVLATDKCRQIIEQLTERFDIVLIDTPPLLSVSDAIPFLSQSDGVVIVARIGLTERASGPRVMETIQRVPDARTLGVVANDLMSEPGSGYGYGYGYGYVSKT